MLGISCDHAASHRAWATALGGLPYPELSDWEPKGQVSRAYDLWNPERGASIRAVLIIDKDGVIRYRRGRITVLDRPRLEARSCECYQVVKTEFDRLLPYVAR